ncbi:MAG: DNA-3-methyladenine glycosylase 2 family protein [Clostridia bacterium]|nr:DNA-3-methyladenine glycosylase 2 family protein [Clostridia bacterium]
MDIYYKNGSVIIENAQNFNVERSCLCGQAFRFSKQRDGSMFGIAFNKGVRIIEYNGIIEIQNCEEQDVKLWSNYFDLERDYGQIEKIILDDERLSVCVPYGSGIRIFKQEPFEAFISFIISANNNIKRISGIVEKLCAYCGEKKELENGSHYYTFPTPERLAALSEEELFKLGTGYRAPYIVKSARRIADGYDLLPLKNMPIESARKELLSFSGVGPKVADCILLFSLGFTNAFPIDVWMRRALRELFFDGREPSKKELESLNLRLGEYSGIVQQYIFNYAREVGLGK